MVLGLADLDLLRSGSTLERPAAHHQTFRFGTRLQRLNSLEASARANINFLEQLYIFHRQQKSSNVSVPVIGSKPVDLWRLRKEVDISGGYETVSGTKEPTRRGCC